MWKKDKQSISSGDASLNIQVGRDFNIFQTDFPTKLVDQKIDEEVNILRKSRFFIEFDRTSAAATLVRRLVEGEFSGGTETVRSRALAWCVRVLSLTDELDKAEECLKITKTLGVNPEIDVADAFMYSKKGDKNAALSTLAKVDLPLSRTSALMIVAHHEGKQKAVEWLKATDIDSTNLDSDGKYFLLSCQLELANWQAAHECLDILTDDDFQETPVLHRMVAITHLLSTVPNEFRSVVLNQLPFHAKGFPLASDKDAIEARRIAHSHFINAAKIEQQLSCPHAATRDDEYALWLELKDPDEANKGKNRLEAKLRDPKSALRLVHLGIQFGIKLDLEAVEQEIEREIVLNGGMTHDAAIARFALAFTQKTPENVASYITRHYDELADYIDKKSMQFLQVEMLSQAGNPKKAIECLDILIEEGLSDVEERRLRRIIAEAEGTDPIEARKEQFENSKALGDLETLVDELDFSGEWDDLCKYGEVLFEKTHSLNDAERFARALSNSNKDERLVEFLKENATLLAQSKDLKMLFCWSLYYEGALIEARSELAKLSNDHDNPNYRALQVNLGVSLGDWSSLSAFVDNEHLKKDKRSAQELINVAQLALHLGSPHAKELIFAAAAKGSDDAGILAAAYFTATTAGWESDADAVQWLNKAAALSGNDGPIQKMTLKDVVDRKPDWDRRESETWQKLSQGDIPMFLAAQSLNKSLIDLILFPALASMNERDPRRRGAIAAYSGIRHPISLDTFKEIGIDATALITLGFLNILDEALEVFETIHVPHSTLSWLFQEKQNAVFHQPSRIKDAHQIRHFLATDVLEKLISSTVPNSDLSAQVGEDLALLIAEAEKVSDNDDIQRIVVRPSPVYRIVSLMEEEADLTAHASILSSCQPIVDKLREKGQITCEEEKKAHAYLRLHEKPWPNQPEISDGAILYLDDLAIAYFLHLGILEKLQTAGFRAIVSPREVIEANELISYESIIGKVNDTIERIRSAVSLRIASGKIKVGNRINADQSTVRSISEHPTFGVLALADHCDAIIVDDRFLNQYINNDENSTQAPILTTLDLLDVLVSASSITLEDQSKYKTQLRRAGYFFVPVSDEELAQYLDASMVKDDKIVETAELKAIRENILRVRMGNWLQLPKEAPWLDMLLKVFIRVLLGLWTTNSDISCMRARSNWIMDQIDVRGWAHRLGGENGDNLVKIGRGAHMLMLLSPPTGASREITNEYWSWVEDRVLTPIKEQFPDLYTWIIEWQRARVTEMAEIDLNKEGAK